MLFGEMILRQGDAAQHRWDMNAVAQEGGMWLLNRSGQAWLTSNTGTKIKGEEGFNHVATWVQNNSRKPNS